MFSEAIPGDASPPGSEMRSGPDCSGSIRRHYQEEFYVAVYSIADELRPSDTQSGSMSTQRKRDG